MAEAKALDDALYCGNSEKFIPYLGEIHHRLIAAWAATGDGRTESECSVRIMLNDSGTIVKHRIESCSDPKRLVRALRKAGPLPVSKDPCFAENLSQFTFELQPQ